MAPGVLRCLNRPGGASAVLVSPRIRRSALRPSCYPPNDRAAGLPFTAMRASIVGGLILCCLVFASGAGAEVLVEQRPGPAATGVLSQGPGGKPSGTRAAADDIVVPAGEHWS